MGYRLLVGPDGEVPRECSRQFYQADQTEQGVIVVDQLNGKEEGNMLGFKNIKTLIDILF